MTNSQALSMWIFGILFVLAPVITVLAVFTGLPWWALALIAFGISRVIAVVVDFGTDKPLAV